MENQIQENPDNLNPKENYYFNRSVIVKDLTIGFFSGLGYIILAFLGVLLIHTMVSFLIWALVLVYLSGIIYFFLKRRHYLSIGLILFVAITPAIVGGCLFIISR